MTVAHSEEHSTPSCRHSHLRLVCWLPTTPCRAPNTSAASRWRSLTQVCPSLIPTSIAALDLGIKLLRPALCLLPSRPLVAPRVRTPHSRGMQHAVPRGPAALWTTGISSSLSISVPALSLRPRQLHLSSRAYFKGSLPTGVCFFHHSFSIYKLSVQSVNLQYFCKFCCLKYRVSYLFYASL